MNASKNYDAPIGRIVPDPMSDIPDIPLDPECAECEDTAVGIAWCDAGVRPVCGPHMDVYIAEGVRTTPYDDRAANLPQDPRLAELAELVHRFVDAMTTPVEQRGTGLKTIRAELDAATPGPWRVLSLETKLAGLTTQTATHNLIRSPNDRNLADCSHESDATLIAHVPTYLAVLLDVAERLEKVRFLREGHETPDTPDEDHPDLYCFECEGPWPCLIEETFQALDHLTPQKSSGEEL